MFIGIRDLMEHALVAMASSHFCKSIEATTPVTFEREEVPPKLPVDIFPGNSWVIFFNETDKRPKVPLPVRLVHSLYLAKAFEIGLIFEAWQIMLMF